MNSDNTTSKIIRFFETIEKYYGCRTEITEGLITDLQEPGRNKFEFIEQYSETVFRITKIRFHYKY